MGFLGNAGALSAKSRENEGRASKPTCPLAQAHWAGPFWGAEAQTLKGM